MTGGAAGGVVRPAMVRGLLGLVISLAASIASTARADERDESLDRGPPVPRVDPFEESPGYLQLQASFFVGDGLRFNNPYRLATPLGEDAESVSRTAPYVDFGAAMLIGRALGIQHGPALRMSIATEGVPQAVFTPSYLLYRRYRAFALYGRLGVPIVATPDLTSGGEVGVGGIFFVRGGIGIAAEGVGDLLWGAGTREVARPLYPVLSGQLGIVLAYEALP